MRNITIDESRDFKGVWIPKEIFTISDLSWTEKILLVEIINLDKLGECFASNKHFADMLGISERQASKGIANLSDKGYINVELRRNGKNKEVTRRVITHIEQKFHLDIEQNFYADIEQKFAEKNTIPNYPTLKNTPLLDELYGATSKEDCTRDIRTIKDKNEIDYNILERQTRSACEQEGITDTSEVDKCVHVIRYYFRKYHDTFGEEHTRLKQSVMRKCVYSIQYPPSETMTDADEYSWETSIDKHFETRYKNCDYHITHFLTEGVLSNRYYETQY